MQFEFRIRFHLLPEDRVALSEALVQLPVARAHLRLVASKLGSKIEDSNRVFLVGGPFASEAEAREDAMRAKRALLLWALQRRLAIDFGDNRRRGHFTLAGAEHFSKLLGGPVRAQIHGVDVYEKVEGQRFVDISLSPGLRVGADLTIAWLAKWYSDNPSLSAREELAAELYCAAHFDTPLRSRFITLMTAIEALLEHQPRASATVAVVQALEKHVKASALARAEKQSLLGSLKWLHTESIGQAGRRTAEQHLSGNLYGGQKPGKYFSDCYELRSTIVHTGRVPVSVDLLEVTNELHRFLGDLLHSAIAIPPLQ